MFLLLIWLYRSLNVMAISRTAAVCGKYLWSSVLPRCPRVAQITNNTCRYISTGVDSMRLGNVGGKTQSYDMNTLEKFIGTWVETDRENYKEFLKATDNNDHNIRFLEKHKTWIRYELEDDEIRCEHGFVDHPRKGAYTCTLGEEFTYFNYFNNIEMKATIFQERGMLKEQHVSPVNPHLLINIEREIVGRKKMVSRSQYKNVIGTITYKKK